jgi:hypothetical protein
MRCTIAWFFPLAPQVDGAPLDTSHRNLRPTRQSGEWTDPLPGLARQTVAGWGHGDNRRSTFGRSRSAIVCIIVISVNAMMMTLYVDRVANSDV